MEQRFFATLHVQEKIVKDSSSGGAFTALTDAWFNRYGAQAVVYGCMMDESLKAKHIRATNAEERNRMRGSKYIGSDVSGIFRLVKADLEQGKFVVFSGTPCQIAGLKSFLSWVKCPCEEQLLTIEVICHGVASVEFFRDYIRHLEMRYKGNAVKCKFRAKNDPGKKQDMEVIFDNGKVYRATSTNYDWFYSVYLKDIILRPSCYKCNYCKQMRFADISLADHWGDARGELLSRSLVVINNDRGKVWMDYAAESVKTEEITKEQINQPHMNAPCTEPSEREAFWKCYRENGYLAAQRHIGNNTAKGKVLYFAVWLIDKMHLRLAAKKMKSLIVHFLRK